MGLGLFGKLPAKGDFITRAIPPEVLSFWEGWLEKVMGGAKHHLAGEWGPVYEASPVWRFWIGPGVFGHAMAGALSASVDKVGRQFPLTLVLSGEGHNHPVPPLSDPMDDWYGTLERALLSAKSGHFDGDIDGFLAALPAPSAAPCALGEDRRNAFFAYGEHGLGQMLADVRDHDHQLAAFERSYWWTGGNEYVGPGMIAMDGVPDAMGFAGMLRGFGPPARVQQPAAPARAAAVAGAGAAAASRSAAGKRETTVPPSELIGDAEAAAAAAAWGASAPREELAWAAPTDAVDDAWTEAITGDEAESPFDLPEEDWDFPDAGPAKEAEATPEPKPEPEPEPEPELQAEDNLFDDGPEPYGIGADAADEDIYASLSEEDEAEEADLKIAPEEAAEEVAEEKPAADEAEAEEAETGPADETPAEEALDEGDEAALVDEEDLPVAPSEEDDTPEAAEETASDDTEGEEPETDAASRHASDSDAPERDGADDADAASESAEADETETEDAEEAVATDIDDGTAEAEADRGDGEDDADSDEEDDAIAEGPEADDATTDDTETDDPQTDDTGSDEAGDTDTGETELGRGASLEAVVDISPEDEGSPFGAPDDAGDDDAGLGQKKPGLRGFFSLRNRRKD